jgi:hypothetical protein
MKKNVNPMATCHDVGACLLRPGCPCTGPCAKAAAPVSKRLAPGVIDGPYYPTRTTTERAARALMVAAMLTAALAVLARLAQLVGWL